MIATEGNGPVVRAWPASVAKSLPVIVIEEYAVIEALLRSGRMTTDQAPRRSLGRGRALQAIALRMMRKQLKVSNPRSAMIGKLGALRQGN